jgi:hypothetical protein
VSSASLSYKFREDKIQAWFKIYYSFLITVILHAVQRVNKTKNTTKIIVGAIEELNLFQIWEMLVPGEW